MTWYFVEILGCFGGYQKKTSDFRRRCDARRIVHFEACSGFPRIAARTLAQPPKAAVVTML